MWCRAIIATIAFAYILCVLILSGLQKEDLDVNTLRKLQRHNVNIEDMNNETLHKECETISGSTTKQIIADDNQLVTLKTIPPFISDKEEDQKIKLSESSLQNIIINYFNNGHTTSTNNTIKSKSNDNEKVNIDEPKPTTDLSNVENFMNIFNNILSKTKEDTVESTTKAIKSSTAFIPRTIRSKITDDKNMEYINNILENFIAMQKITTTNRPIVTNQVDYDFIAQKINEILAKPSNKDIQKLILYATRSTTVIDEHVTDKVLLNDSIQYIRDTMRLSNPIKMFGPAKYINTSNKDKQFEEKDVSYQSARLYTEDELSPVKFIANSPNQNQHYKNRGTKKQITTLSEDIVREISEKVKANVLQDLQNIITTTTKEPNPTTKRTTLQTKTTTVRQEKSTTVNVKHIISQDKIATDIFGKFMEMFQQYNKKNSTSPTQNGDAQDNIKTANAPVTIVSHITSPRNINYIKPHPVNIKSVIINPFNPLHTPVIQTAMFPNEPYTFLNSNTAIQSIPTDAEPIPKIAQLNIFNTKNNYHPPPITIQTNSYEVPPLGLPAHHSLVYQNIVVPTKHPTKKLRHDNRYQSYSVHHGQYYDGDKYKERQPSYAPQIPKNLDNGFGIDRHERNRDDNNKYKDKLPFYPPQQSRDINNEFGKNELNKDDDNMNKYKDKLPSYLPQQSRDYKNEFGRYERNRDDDNKYKVKLPSYPPQHSRDINNEFDKNERNRDDDDKYKDKLPSYPLQQSRDINNEFGRYERNRDDNNKYKDKLPSHLPQQSRDFKNEFGRYERNRDDDNKYKVKLQTYPPQQSRDNNNELGKNERNRDDDNMNKYRDKLPSYLPQQSRDFKNEFGRYERNRDDDNKYNVKLQTYPPQQSRDNNNELGKNERNRDDDNMNKYRDKLPSYLPQQSRDSYNEFGRYERNRDDDNKYKDNLQSYPPQQSRDNNNKFGRHELNKKLINDENLSENNRHKPIGNKDYGRTQYNDHNMERFHEQLETADDWPRNPRPKENSHVDDYSTPKFFSRHQLPLNDAKKRSSDSDTHFRNFLKTQEKVNDMLERILATKAIDVGTHSVETLDF